MPSFDKNKQNSQKKARLGRGLGSLLSTDMHDFEESKAKKTNNQKPSKPKQKAIPTASPVEQSSSSDKSVVTRPAQSVDKSSDKVVSNQKPPVVKEEPLVTAKVVDTPKEELSVEGTSNDFKRIWDLGIDKVQPNKRQPRKDFEKEPLQELANSIKEQGILQPITVRKTGETFEIIAGERRWRAAQIAGLHKVPVIIKDVSDQKVMELALIENIQRENLNPVEEAIAYQQLIEDYEMSQAEVAQKVGKNRTTITNSLRVLTLPKEVKRALRSHEISVGHAKVLLSVEDPADQVRFLKNVINQKLSVRALEKEVRKKPSESGSFDTLDVSERLAKSLSADLQKTLGTKVQIKYKNGKGRIEISFYSDDELTSISEKVKEAWL